MDRKPAENATQVKNLKIRGKNISIVARQVAKIWRATSVEPSVTIDRPTRQQAVKDLVSLIRQNYVLNAVAPQQMTLDVNRNDKPNKVPG